MYVSHAVPPPSGIVITPFTQSVTHNSNATFNCTVTSLTQPAIAWSTDATNNNIPGSTTTTSQGSNYTSTLVLNGVTLDSIGRYTCNATNDGGNVNATASLVVTGKDLILFYTLHFTFIIMHFSTFVENIFRE